LYFPTLVQASAGAIGSAQGGTAVSTLVQASAGAIGSAQGDTAVSKKIESVKSGMFYRV